MGLEVPVFGFGTFSVIAAAVESPPSFTAIHPAGRGEWAVQGCGAGTTTGAPAILAADALPSANTLPEKAPANWAVLKFA